MSAVLEPHVGDASNDGMTYLIAGNLDQPRSAFTFMMSEVGPNYTYVSFSPQGWSAKATAERISKNIREHDYQARVFAISLGDHVARYLEEEFGDEIEIYSINPCTFKDALQPKWYNLTTCLAIPAEVVCHVIGWPMMIPFIDIDGGNYSPVMLVDQYLAMAYDNPPLGTSRTCGVILSTNDEYLKNDYLRELFKDSKIIEIDTVHAEMRSAAGEYQDGVERLLEP